MPGTLATRMAFGQELVEIGKTNENFVVCSADTKTCGLDKFGKLFPERVLSFGIAEQNLVAGAAGLAACGNKVFLAHICRVRINAGLRAGENLCLLSESERDGYRHARRLQVGGDGATHAAVDFKGPLYIRLHRNPVDDIYDPKTFRFQWGKTILAADYGSDMTMVSSGILLGKALSAARILKGEGVGVRVLDMPAIKPLDDGAILRAARETGAIMTIEDHSVIGGLGAAVAEVVVENEPVPMRRIGIQDRFGESGDPELIYKDHGMDVYSIVAKAKALVARKQARRSRAARGEDIMFIGCCVNMLPKKSEDPGAWYAPEIKQAGFDYIELPLGQVVGQSQAQFEEMTAYLRDVGLPVYACNNFFIREIRLVGPALDRPKVRDFYQKALAWAQQMGCRYVVFGSPWSKYCPEGFSKEKAFEQMSQWCVEIGDEAKKRNIVTAPEPNNRQETNLINTFADAVALAKSADHPNIHCLQDITT